MENVLRIRRLTLKRFKSVTFSSIDFANPTFLVGKNGSGKSNIVSAFEFLADCMQLPLQAVFDRAGGISAVRNKTAAKGYPPNLGFLVEFGSLNGTVAKARYAFEIRALKNHAFEVVREQCIVTPRDGKKFEAPIYYFDRSSAGLRSNIGMSPSFEPSALMLPLIAGLPVFQPVLKALRDMRVTSAEPGRLRGLQDPDAGTALKHDGSNTTSVLQEIARKSPENLDRISEILQTIVPNTVGVRVKKLGKNLGLEFTQSWGDPSNKLKFDAHSMSDGTLRAIGLLAAVYQEPMPSLLAIEEPEATMHPGALGPILDVLRHASRNFQVVVTTHSPDLLDASWIEPDMLRIVDWKNGSTRVSQLSDTTKQAVKEHLASVSDLIRVGALTVEEGLFEEVPVAQLSLFQENLSFQP